MVGTEVIADGAGAGDDFELPQPDGTARKSAATVALIGRGDFGMRASYSVRRDPSSGNRKKQAPENAGIDSYVFLTSQSIRFRLIRVRTTLDLPEDLLEEARRLLGFKSKTDTVVLSLTELIRRRRLDELKSLAGKVQLEIDVAGSRRRPAPVARGERPRRRPRRGRQMS
jgi:hypothetical protein